APISLQRLPPQIPSCAPAHAATFSPGAVASGAARQGRGRDALLAAARTVRAKSAMARPRTIRAATPSPSPTGRDDAGHAEPLPSAYWSDAPLPPARWFAAPTGIARLWARSERLFRPWPDGRRFRRGVPEPRECPSAAEQGPGSRK